MSPFTTRLARASMFLAPVLALASGCAVATGPEGAAEDGVASDVSALPISNTGGGTGTCRGIPLPKPKVCVKYYCDGDAWAPEPVAKGTACTMTNGQIGACTGTAVPQCAQQVTGSMIAKYYVLSVEYAPPGAASNVDYGMGSQWGTSTSTTSSFSNAMSVTVSNKTSFLGFGSGGISVSGGTTSEDSTNSSLDVKATTQTDFTINGDEDAVDHALDRIYLWLNPEVDVTAFGNNVSWQLAAQSGTTPHIVYVTPTWLLNDTVPSDVQIALNSAGITQADYAEILKVDPYANANPLVDANRYVFMQELPYEPVTTATDKPTTSKFAITKSTTYTTGTESKVSYNVGVTLKGSAGFLGFASVGLEASDKMTWTSDNKASHSTGTSMSATATITQPGFNYTGPIYLDVYLDTIYNTFLFVLNSPATSPLKFHLPIGGVTQLAQ